SLVLTFAQSPTDKFLNITNIACDIQLSSSQVLQQVTLFVGTSSGNNDLFRPMSIRGNAIPEIQGNDKTYSIVTNQIFFKVGPGRFPSIDIFTTSAASPLVVANCVIVGNLTDN